ncbi:hypothetical protein BpHYR1_026909 [Brachionus plicatilis]|uniref:Uncharacterized protein n=1 Tax=Brachionus plicatilis TaxID=10195 RepID=A0A3M7RPN8_BRAPC|nr:hypothetical protein BpHYR1_026909 [Brachionus plicatilis]
MLENNYSFFLVSYLSSFVDFVSNKKNCLKSLDISFMRVCFSKQRANFIININLSAFVLARRDMQVTQKSLLFDRRHRQSVLNFLPALFYFSLTYYGTIFFSLL